MAHVLPNFEAMMTALALACRGSGKWFFDYNNWIYATDIPNVTQLKDSEGRSGDITLTLMVPEYESEDYTGPEWFEVRVNTVEGDAEGFDAIGWVKIPCPPDAWEDMDSIRVVMDDMITNWAKYAPTITKA